MAQNRKMPNCRDVIKYWEDTLVEMGKVDDGELMMEFETPNTGICFACGWVRPLQRAHIKARCEGGSDSVDNIHLLCEWCHRASEYKDGDDYWEWLKDQNMIACAAQVAFTLNPSLINKVMGKI